MNTTVIERRSPWHLGRTGLKFDACTVAQAIQVQAYSGTLSAVEYLKARGVDGVVILRVLIGDRRRDTAEA